MPGVLGIAGARYLGLATGLVLLAGVALTQWSVAPSRAALGLELKLTAVTHGELEVGPAGGPALLARGLRPGHEAVGAVTVRNQTSARLAVRPLLTDGPGALDGTVQYELTVGARPVYSGPASGLRKGGAAFLLASGERGTVSVRAWVAEGHERQTRGRAGEWRLAFTTEVVR